MSSDLYDYTLISKYRANMMLRTFIAIESAIEQIRIVGEDVFDPEDAVREILGLLNYAEYDLNSLGQDIDMLVRETGSINHILEGDNIESENDAWLSNFGVTYLNNYAIRLRDNTHNPYAVPTEFIHSTDKPSIVRYIPPRTISNSTKKKLFGGVEIVKSIP